MKMVRNMVKVLLLLQMVATIKVISLRMTSLDMENIIGKMVNHTKVNGIIVR